MVFLSAGKAYAIFNTEDAADAAISKINSGLVVGGRYVFVVDVIYLVSYSVTIFSSSGVLFVLSILELSWQINCWNL